MRVRGRQIGKDQSRDRHGSRICDGGELESAVVGLWSSSLSRTRICDSKSEGSGTMTAKEERDGGGGGEDRRRRRRKKEDDGGGSGGLGGTDVREKGFFLVFLL